MWYFGCRNTTCAILLLDFCWLKTFEAHMKLRESEESYGDSIKKLAKQWTGLHENSDTFPRWSLYTRRCNYPLFLRWEEFEYKNSPHSIWTNQPPWGFLGSVFFFGFLVGSFENPKKTLAKKHLVKISPYEKNRKQQKRNGQKPALDVFFLCVEWFVVVPLRRMMDWGSSWGSLEWPTKKRMQLQRLEHVFPGAET